MSTPYVVRGLLLSVEGAPFHFENFTMDMEVAQSDVLEAAMVTIQAELDRRCKVSGKGKQS